MTRAEYLCPQDGKFCWSARWLAVKRRDEMMRHAKRRRRLVVYYCAAGQGWHIGSKASWRGERKARIQRPRRKDWAA